MRTNDPTRRALLHLPLLLVALLASAPAAAGDTPTARAFFEQGVKLFAAEDYAGALAAFAASHEKRPKASVLFNIGMCEKALFRHAESIATFERYLADESSHRKPGLRLEAEQALAELEQLVGRVVIEGAPDGAQVRVNDAVVGTTPLARPLRLDPGRHSVVVTQAGFRALQTWVTVVAGAEIPVHTTLVPEPADPPREAAADAPVPVKPPVETPPAVTSVTTSKLLLSPPASPGAAPAADGVSGLFIGGLVAGGLAAVATGVGGYFAYQRQVVDIDNANDAIRHDDRTEYLEVQDDADVHEVGLIAGFASAGVFLTAAVVLLVLDLLPGDETAGGVTPTPRGAVVRF